MKANSIPEYALLRALDEGNRLVLPQAVEDEYREVIFRPEFDRYVPVARRQHLLDIVLFAAARLEPIEIVRQCRDPNDDKYLALAAAAKADAIVSSDADLLAMHPWRGTAIPPPAAFLAFEIRVWPWACLLRMQRR